MTTLEVCEFGLWDMALPYRHGSEKMRIFVGHGVYVEGGRGNGVGVLDLSTDICQCTSGGVPVDNGARIVHNSLYCKSGLQHTETEGEKK